MTNKPLTNKPLTIGTLGGGEAGKAIAATLTQVLGGTVIGFDIKAMDETSADALSEDGGLRYVPSREALGAQASLILSVVTADDALSAARQMAPFLTSDHIFCDGNSVSPQTKRDAALIIEATGASYVDMAIMAPIHPRGHKTPLLIASPDEGRIRPVLEACGFDFQWQGNAIGDASLVKMLRSILIKGMESLICECVTAAQGQGLDTDILTSAGKTLGISDMPALADYVMERAATHGRRRAAELREVAKTLTELGLSNHMPTAIAKHQDMVADMGLSAQFDGAIPRDRAVLAQTMRDHQKS